MANAMTATFALPTLVSVIRVKTHPFPTAVLPAANAMTATFALPIVASATRVNSL